MKGEILDRITNQTANHAWIIDWRKRLKNGTLYSNPSMKMVRNNNVLELSKAARNIYNALKDKPYLNLISLVIKIFRSSWLILILKSEYSFYIHFSILIKYLFNTYHSCRADYI